MQIASSELPAPPVSPPPRPQYASLEAWLGSTLPEKTPEDVVAYNFNLAEGGCWTVEVIGASSFDSRTGDWACPPEAWSCRPSQFEIPYDWASNWQDAAKYVASHVANFILRSSHPSAEVLRQAEAVCVGFVDGDAGTACRASLELSASPEGRRAGWARRQSTHPQLRQPEWPPSHIQLQCLSVAHDGCGDGLS